MSTLTVRTGNKPGACLRIKHDGAELLDSDGGNTYTGTISGWDSAVVCTSAGESARFWRLSPAGPDVTENEIAFSGFFVRGRFTVTEKINHARRASEAFRSFLKK